MPQNGVACDLLSDAARPGSAIRFVTWKQSASYLKLSLSTSGSARAGENAHRNLSPVTIPHTRPATMNENAGAENHNTHGLPDIAKTNRPRNPTPMPTPIGASHQTIGLKRFTSMGMARNKRPAAPASPARAHQRTTVPTPPRCATPRSSNRRQGKGRTFPECAHQNSRRLSQIISPLSGNGQYHSRLNYAGAAWIPFGRDVITVECRLLRRVNQCARSPSTSGMGGASGATEMRLGKARRPSQTSAH